MVHFILVLKLYNIIFIHSWAIYSSYMILMKILLHFTLASRKFSNGIRAIRLRLNATLFILLCFIFVILYHISLKNISQNIYISR